MRGPTLRINVAYQQNLSPNRLATQLRPVYDLTMSDAKHPPHTPTHAAKIAVIGSVNLDFVIQSHTLPKAGETIANGQFTALPGGKGANVALAAHRLYAASPPAQSSVALWACVGKDSHAETALATLRAEGVDLSKIEYLDTAATGIAFVNVSDDGENQIVVASGANMEIPSGYARAIKAQAIITQFEIPTAIIQAAIRDFDGFVALNASPVGPDLAALLPHTDLVIVNEGEYHAYEHALADYAGRVAVTLGAKGAVLYESGTEIARATPPPITVVDTTGAGDCFAAALTVALLEGQSPQDAVRFACTAGALTTTKIGTQSAAPLRAAIDALL